MSKVKALTRATLGRAACLTAAAALLSSCATMFCGAKQKVTFTSNPPGARVERDGQFIGVTPVTAKVKRSYAAVYTFSKENHAEKSVVHQGGFNPLALLSLFSYGIGFAVDYGTGAMWRYGDKQLSVLLTPVGYAAQPASPGRPLVSALTGTSDVDTNIPATKASNETTFAVIVANESYRREQPVAFAKNDGEVFKQYCIQTLGMPERNVSYVADATLNDLRSEVSWLRQVAEAHEGEASLIFYYAGHGVPDESTKSAYLLPVDGNSMDVSTGYRLDELYRQLGSAPARAVTVLMDACFSGAQRSGEMLAAARGVAIKAQAGKPVGSMVVLSAAQGDETAYPYHEKEHGLFTYFLLKKLQETKGNVTLGELSSYITARVKRQSIVVNRKSQTPTVTPSAEVENWKKLKLR